MNKPTLTELGKMSTKGLLEVYNAFAPEPIARFADHMSAFRRTKALMASLVAPQPVATKTHKTAKAGCVVLVSVGKSSDQTEYHSVLAAFKALKLPLGVHQKFRRQVKLNGKATFADKFVFTYPK